MTEVKAAILTLAAAAAFLIATVLGVGSRMWREAPIPSAVRVGAATPVLAPADAPPAVVAPLAGKEGPAISAPAPSAPEADRSVSSTVPAILQPQQAPAALTAPSGPAPVPPGVAIGPFLPVPPPVAPGPELKAPPPAEVPTEAPVTPGEIVARPVQSGQVDEFDDEGDTASTSSANSRPDDSSEPAPGRPGHAPGRGSGGK